MAVQNKLQVGYSPGHSVYLNMPSLQLVSQLFRLATIAQIRSGTPGYLQTFEHLTSYNRISSIKFAKAHGKNDVIYWPII